MSLIQLFVSPDLPTALDGQASVDVPGYDLWLYPIYNVHVVPTKLDILRFEKALSRALQLYPHAAGQLRCSDGHWSVELTNTAVPVEVDYKLHTSSDTFLDGDWVNQDDLSTLLNHRPINPCPINDGGPLLYLKLTFLDNETCIGISWHHLLGDGILMSRFTHTLSQFYQDLPAVYAAPTFGKYQFPKPSSIKSAEFWPSVPHLHTPCPFSDFGEKYAEFIRNFQDLKWRIDSGDLAELRSVLSSRGPNGGYLSQQDCLSAYVVAVLNRNTSTPVDTVTSISSYRSISAPFIAADVAGNMLQNVPAAVPTDMAGIATALRHALVRCRKPDYIYDVMMVANDLMLEAANSAKIVDVIHRDDTVLLVDSNTTIDWCSAHFGCPDGTRFYTTTMGKQFLRCFRSNPVKGDDGVWRARQSVDISMGVATELKPRLLETLARGIRYMLNGEPARS